MSENGHQIKRNPRSYVYNPSNLVKSIRPYDENHINPACLIIIGFFIKLNEWKDTIKRGKNKIIPFNIGFHVDHQWYHAFKIKFHEIPNFH